MRLLFWGARLDDRGARPTPDVENIVTVDPRASRNRVRYAALTILALHGNPGVQAPKVCYSGTPPQPIVQVAASRRGGRVSYTRNNDIQVRCVPVGPQVVSQAVQRARLVSKTGTVYLRTPQAAAAPVSVSTPQPQTVLVRGRAGQPRVVVLRAPPQSKGTQPKTVLVRGRAGTPRIVVLRAPPQAKGTAPHVLTVRAPFGARASHVVVLRAPAPVAAVASPHPTVVLAAKIPPRSVRVTLVRAPVPPVVVVSVATPLPQVVQAARVAQRRGGSTYVRPLPTCRAVVAPQLVVQLAASRRGGHVTVLRTPLVLAVPCPPVASRGTAPQVVPARIGKRVPPTRALYLRAPAGGVVVVYTASPKPVVVTVAPLRRQPPRTVIRVLATPAPAQQFTSAAPPPLTILQTRRWTPGYGGLDRVHALYIRPFVTPAAPTATPKPIVVLQRRRATTPPTHPVYLRPAFIPPAVPPGTKPTVVLQTHRRDAAVTREFARVVLLRTAAPKAVPAGTAPTVVLQTRRRDQAQARDVTHVVILRPEGSVGRYPPAPQLIVRLQTRRRDAESVRDIARVVVLRSPPVPTVCPAPGRLLLTGYPPILTGQQLIVAIVDADPGPRKKRHLRIEEDEWEILA